MYEVTSPQNLLLNQPKNFSRPRVVIISILIIGIISALGFYFWQKSGQGPAARPSYVSGYRLVSEKVSQSAPILISLPFAMDKTVAQQNVKFDPQISGAWLASDSEKEIVFKPKEPLALNRYYSVELALQNSEASAIKADFLADEDPKILAIFPKENSEAPENSEITIIFNRPMVPLTTLSYMEPKDVPVEITPATEGKFKWTTTRNLQFIPDDRLIRSSNYKVKIKSGLVSMDGLALAETESNFTTRKLRYLELTQGEIVYNQPISIYFNQPVDLEKTKSEISLKNVSTGQEISFIAEYGEKLVKSGKTGESMPADSYGMSGAKNFLAGIASDLGFNFWQKKESVLEKDYSIIRIYNKSDRFGREKLWDFENNYQLSIKKAYPAEGEIILDETRASSVYAAGVISNISAESEKTNYASADFFDPQGKLWVEFYEEIDLGKSDISSSQLKETGYGEKCKDEEYISQDCEKVQDKKKIYLTFNAEKIGLGQEFSVDFEKIVNTAGLVINKEKIARTVKVYPQFKVLRTSPQNNAAVGASLTTLTICSNSPILPQAKEDYKKYIKANLDYEVIYWGNSWRVSSVYSGEICGINEFRTDIGYGLMPLSLYVLDLALEDVFGQKIDYSLSFTTGKMPDEHLSFYHLQQDYNVTSPEKTKLTYAVENMEYVHINICKLKPTDFLYRLEKRLSWNEATPFDLCEQYIEDAIELSKRYWLKNYFNINIKDYFENPLGHYVLTFSHPNYKSSYWDWQTGRQYYDKIYQRTYVTVTNLAAAEKRIQPDYAGYYGGGQALSPEELKNLNNIYWVTNMADMTNVQGAKIDLYRNISESGLQLAFAGSSYTDNQGIAKTSLVNNLKGAVISKGGDSTVIPTSESRLDYAETAFSARKVYLYADKPIYGPGQEVFLKGIYRIGYDGNYEIYRDRKVSLKTYNSRGDEVFSKELEINDFGTFNTQFVLPNDSPLGTWRVCIDEWYDCIYFDVAEYVPAPFEVSVKSDKEEYVSKDTANLEINAKYYFGVALDAGEVSYTVSSQNYYFDKYDKEYFNFGSGGYGYWRPYGYGEKFLLRGRTSLDSQGKAQISQELDFEKLFKNKEDRESKIIVFDVTVKNSQGQSVSSQKSFLVHAGEFYLGIKSDKLFLGKNEKFNLKIKSVDTQGNDTKVRNISLNIYKLDWIYSKRQEAGGGYSYKWEKKRELVQNYSFDTDGGGNYSKELQISKEGQYEIEVSASDKRNNLVWSTYNIYVYGDGQASVMPTKDTTLELQAEKINLNVGEEGSIIIKSPYQKAKALIAIERGKVFDYQIIEIEGNFYNYKFTIKEEYLPNVFVSVVLQSAEPELKFGQVEFKINTERREINIEVNSNKKNYLPGEEVVLDILTTDYQKNPVSTEMSLAVVDLSILALEGNPKKNPIAFFYGGFPLTVSTASNIKDILTEVDIQTKGGSGGSDEALAEKKRGVFKETAFWQAVVRTDASGRAQVKFVLPDNLTTWQAETLGVTQDAKFGVNYQEFISRKELMAVPLKPRFILPGDIFYIGAQIFNQSQSKQKITVSLQSTTLSLIDKESEKEIKIDSGKSETVYFQVQAPAQIEDGEHKFIIQAKGEGLEDTVEQAIEISRNDTYEITATSNYTSGNLTTEYVFLPEGVVKDKGKISIKSSATLAVFLSDALNYLLDFPYGCSEQIASKLNAIAIVKKGLNLPNLNEKFNLEKIKFGDKEYTIEEAADMGLAKIYNNQQWDGGFSYWSGGESDFYLTLHVVDALNNLSLAGFQVSQSNMNKAVGYLRNGIRSKMQYEDENSYRNRLILTSYTLFRISSFRDDGFLTQKIIQIANDSSFINDKISNNNLSYLAVILTNGFDAKLKNKIFDTLDNRINIDARGAFIATGQNIAWRQYETAIKNTALYLKAQVAAKKENPISEKVLRWLLNSRSKDGAWGSTNNTLTVVDALTDFLQWKKETKSNFDLSLLINGKEEGSYNFIPETILNQFQKEIPLSELKFNEINTVSFSKTNNNNLPNNLYYDIYLKYYLPADQIAPRDEGFSIERGFYNLEDTENKNPLTEAKAGDVLREHIKITVPLNRNYVAIEDFIPAGMEIVNLDLATEQKSLLLQETELEGRELHPSFKEFYDDRAFFFTESLSPGVYEFDYYVRALIKGKFIHLPSVVSEMYFPENFGRTAAGYFEIK